MTICKEKTKGSFIGNNNIYSGEDMITELPEDANLKQYQEYIAKMKIDRGFNHEKLMEAYFLSEECGELMTAVRKHGEGYKNTQDHMSCELDGSVREEIADILIFLLHVANLHNIDVDKAFREKEAYNDIRYKDRLKKCS